MLGSLPISNPTNTDMKDNQPVRTPPTQPRVRRRRLTGGRQARTVGVSLFPAHVRWLAVVKRRTNLGPSAYLQALAHADMTSGGLVLAKALAVENEG